MRKAGWQKRRRRRRLARRVSRLDDGDEQWRNKVRIISLLYCMYWIEGVPNLALGNCCGWQALVALEPVCRDGV
jgi:hypothetical protein